MKKVFESIDFVTEDININIIPLIKKDINLDIEKTTENCYKNLDCSYGRILTNNGIYNCPINTDDYRGRAGTDFKDYTKHAMLDSPYCSYCMSKNKRFFSIDVS